MVRPITLYALGLVSVSGCYSYVPVELREAPLGGEVRAVVSTERQVELWNILGVDKRTVSGRVLENNGASLLLGVATTGLGSDALYQRIRLPAADVLRLDVRQAEPGRTWALAGGLAVGAVVGSIVALKGGERGGGQPTGPEPVERLGSFLLRLLVPR